MAHSKSSKAGGFWKLLLILAAAVVLFSLVTWYKNRKDSKPAERFSTSKKGLRSPAAFPRERFSESAVTLPDNHEIDGAIDDDIGVVSGLSGPAPLETATNEVYLPVSDKKSGATSPADAFPADRLKPEDLLPKDAANSKWAQANPAGQGDIKDQNFLTAGYHIGFNTQGNSLRNASHDLRSTPPNPRYTVSIWQQSDIQPDLGRRPLES